MEWRKSGEKEAVELGSDEDPVIRLSQQGCTNNTAMFNRLRRTYITRWILTATPHGQTPHYTINTLAQPQDSSVGLVRLPAESGTTWNVTDCRLSPAHLKALFYGSFQVKLLELRTGGGFHGTAALPLSALLLSSSIFPYCIKDRLFRLCRSSPKKGCSTDIWLLFHVHLLFIRVASSSTQRSEHWSVFDFFLYLKLETDHQGMKHLKKDYNLTRSLTRGWKGKKIIIEVG